MRQKTPADSKSESKNTQRRRLLAGMLAAISADGYRGATIANVIARAHVSRPTFYEYFTDKDDCFLALYRDTSRRLTDQVALGISESPPQRALDATIRQLTAHAEHDPAHAQFLASYSLAGGPHALDERERMIGQIGNQIQTARASISSRTPAPDLPAQAAIGATQWLISQGLRRGERDLAQLTQELTDWLRCYERPITNHRWSTLDPGPQPESSPSPELAHSLSAPALSKTSKPGQRARWRILMDAAEGAMQTGYNGSTVAAISARARLDRRTFYDHFHSRGQVFLALHELAFQQSMAVGAAAYFSEEKWPERVWHCLLATSQVHAAYPALAHVGFVESHALGLPAIQRVEETRQAFATLLRADNEHTSSVPSPTAADAIGAAIFEIANDQVRRRQAKDLPRYAYHAAYLVLAPFLGVQAADRFVQRKLEDAEQTSG